MISEIKSPAAPASAMTALQEIEILSFLKDAKWSGFAQSLFAQHGAKGKLSPAQWDAAAKMFAKCAQSKAAAPAPAKLDGFFAAFSKAANVKAAFPVVHIPVVGGHLKLTLVRSTTHGDYVKIAGKADAATGSGSDYLGFVTDADQLRPGKGYATWLAKEDLLAGLSAFAEAPATVVAAFGRQTGICGCCGRVLSDPVSVAIGIGPICRGRLGL